MNYRAGMEMKYYNWYHDKPSSIENECVMIDPNLNYHWLDTNCNTQAYFICVRGMYAMIVIRVLSCFCC